jgi:tetratricopeptide (TPR) repeat protein
MVDKLPLPPSTIEQPAKSQGIFAVPKQIHEQILGQQHPDYATSLNNLAVLYQSQGKYEQALPLYQQSLIILKQVLGNQHPHTKIVAENYELCRAKITTKMKKWWQFWK